MSTVLVFDCTQNTDTPEEFKSSSYVGELWLRNALTVFWSYWLTHYLTRDHLARISTFHGQLTETGMRVTLVIADSETADFVAVFLSNAEKFNSKNRLFKIDHFTYSEAEDELKHRFVIHKACHHLLGMYPFPYTIPGGNQIKHDQETHSFLQCFYSHGGCGMFALLLQEQVAKYDIHLDARWFIPGDTGPDHVFNVDHMPPSEFTPMIYDAFHPAGIEYRELEIEGWLPDADSGPINLLNFSSPKIGTILEKFKAGKD